MNVTSVILRQVEAADLDVFFENQLNAEAGWMAAFTAKDSSDRAAFDGHWKKLMGNAGVVKRTIVVDGRVAGNVMSYAQFGKPSVCYWIGREFWGRGVATAAVRMMLEVVTERPLYARVAEDNAASRRVLEKCGFVVCEKDRGFAEARGEEIGEVVMWVGEGG